ncbi:GNAT family N-acetyltransferase [Romboutsia hominis]|uniref:GNAT acetyltransferase n=1 Tax=Romboutsia hominis TaxID=1507512 RepID=A0A2P2BR94_9FIRM|nr:GNAT family protein [Romboutsia hominis]MCH1960211.1 GNAT family N-acetyltransferase [Romboutsia hominis]MCH1969354.1 GNAT family N-acetyltransferase [Romboutsia hominis]CEI72871.1 GNAT acetyltransferase [Romboutsia hominis]
MYNSKMNVLETKRCILRPITLKDAPDLHECYKQEIVVKYLPFKAHQNIYETREFIKNFFLKKYNENKLAHYAIVLKSNKKVIGNIGFNNISKDNKKGEIGICINPSYWGYDLSTELAREIVKYGFKKLKLEEIIAITYEDNNYSIKSLENLNFEYIKTYFKTFHSSNKKVKCNLYKISRKNYLMSKYK